MEIKSKYAWNRHKAKNSNGTAAQAVSSGKRAKALSLERELGRLAKILQLFYVDLNFDLYMTTSTRTSTPTRIWVTLQHFIIVIIPRSNSQQSIKLDLNPNTSMLLPLMSKYMEIL